MTVRSRRLRHPIFRLAAGLLLTIGLCAGSANAQVVIVNPTGEGKDIAEYADCLLYTSPSPRDRTRSRMPSSA